MKKNFIYLILLLSAYVFCLWLVHSENDPKKQLGQAKLSRKEHLYDKIPLDFKFPLSFYDFDSLKVKFSINETELKQHLYLKNQSQKVNDTQNDRLKRLRSFCNKYELNNKVTTFWRKASNQIKGQNRFCTTRNCPIVVDDKNKLMWCFVQKVASTSIKNFFVHLSNQTIEHYSNFNVTAFHLEANDILHRISPMYYSSKELNHFYKMIFVRHPFKRLVSAFEDKANRSRSEESYFFDKFWDPIMIKERGESQVNKKSQPTFEEFVNYLIRTHPFQYDEHWSPYWTRCEPCWVHYDFIGKLETSQNDLKFIYAKYNQDISNMFWENKNYQTKTDQKVKQYFLKLKPKKIIDLYKIYFLDFQMFGYTIEEIFQ